MTTPKRRSTLPQPEARRRYLEIGSLMALEQIRLDAGQMDDRPMAIGPFARLDAGRVGARDGKTRGAITNLFGSQAAYQVATMDLVLDAGAWADALDPPPPRDFVTADAWADALFTWLSSLGPRHGAEPEPGYAALWTLWLGTVPYGMWSERIAGPSMEEYQGWARQLERICAEAMAHFGLCLRDDVALADLACGIAGLTEGVWLNQCLTRAHPLRTDDPVAASLLRAGRLLWRGALAP